MGLSERTFNKGEIIIREGDTGRSFFRLIDGKAGVYADYEKKEPFRLAILEPGEFFGEMSILEEYPRSATVVAESKVTAIEIPGDEMNSFLAEDPGMILELMKHMAKRVQAMAADYDDAVNLLEQLRQSKKESNKSFFSKIKKHVNLYQANKNKISEPDTEKLRREFDEVLRVSKNVESYNSGMLIFKEGAAGKCMYIMYAGKVGLYSDYKGVSQNGLAVYEDVGFFGEMGLISGDERGATAVVEADGTLLEAVFQEDLESIFKTCPAKIDMILRHLSYRLRKINSDFLVTCKEITETYGEA